MQRVLALAILLVCARPAVAKDATPAPAGKRGASSSASAEVKAAAARIDKLRKAAVAGDELTAEAALDELRALGGPARKALLGALRQILAKDKAAVLKGAAIVSAKGAGTKFEDVLERVEQAREAAHINLAHLEKGEPVRKAHDHHDKLVKLLTELNKGCAARLALRRLTHRRPALLEMFRELAPAGDAEFDEASEAKLLAAAEKALGKPLAEVVDVPSLAERREPPQDRLLRHLWFYRACREIEAYNTALRPELSPGEWENLKLVNRYREALGILPFELDLRLVQAARRHSREMQDEQYFSHQSPTPGLRRHGDRMRAAGYEQGGYSENIAVGPPDAEQTFWGWFGSPGHHRNLVHPHSTAIGIGMWGRYWTQNMGVAPRLMLLPPARRAEATIKGDELKPQR